MPLPYLPLGLGRHTFLLQYSIRRNVRSKTRTLIAKIDPVRDQEDAMTRATILFSFVVGIFTLGGTTSSFAYYEGPWCLKASLGRGGVVEVCHYRTFEQCLVDRPFYGNTAFCIQNARYLPYWR